MAAEYKEKQLVVFKLDREEFGTDIALVREIIKPSEIIPIPEAQKYIRGIINLRGKIIPVIDLRIKLEIRQREIEGNSRVIIIEENNNTLGMLVDAASEVLRISESMIKPTPKALQTSARTEYVEGIVTKENRLIILLNPLRICNEVELNQLSNLTALPEKKENVQSEETVTNINKEAETREKALLVIANDRAIPPEASAPVVRPAEKKHHKKREVPTEFHFITHTGGKLKNVQELHNYIKSLDEDKFRQYVNEHKNDFYNWIKHAVKDDELADRIKHIKKKENISQEILKQITSEV